MTKKNNQQTDIGIQKLNLLLTSIALYIKDSYLYTLYQTNHHSTLNVNLMPNKIELIIKTDSQDNDVSLSAMSLEAAHSFLTLLESLTKIVELTPDSQDVKIEIKEGSAYAAAVGGEAINVMKTELTSIIDNKSSNSEIVKEWRKIQSLVAANGLSYEINFVDRQNNKTEFKETIKKSKTFYTKSIKKTYESSIKFIAGKLIEAGGKKPNIHIEDRRPIACTEADAHYAARDFLYQFIRISVWEKKSEDGEPIYQLCDVYHSQREYEEVKEFFEALENYDTIERLTIIHNRIKELLTQKNYEGVLQLLNPWAHLTTDIQTLKIILVITKSFKDNETLSPKIKQIAKIFSFLDAQYAKQHKK